MTTINTKEPRNMSNGQNIPEGHKIYQQFHSRAQLNLKKIEI
jgi:hypothetical protein